MARIDIVITYDVNTEDAAGRRRLRKVAKVCEAYGQRVQKSVFECSVTAPQMERMKTRLLRIIDKEADSLRIYRLIGGREGCVETYGRDTYEDYESPQIV
jgi:CRISPR-associated protein Cas2